LYASPKVIRVIKVRRIRWAGHIARMRNMRNAYKILVARPEGKRLLGRPRHRCEYYKKIDHKKIGWEDVNWMHMAQDRYQWWALVNMLMNLLVP
jgi:hypothetical protein